MRSVRRRVAAAGGLLSMVGVVTAAVLALGMSAAGAVEYGNPDYLGILSAQPPTGFPVSPAAMDLSKGPVTLSVGVAVTNLTESSHSVPIMFSVHRIMTYKGQDVSDGQPGQPGISFPVGAAPQTTQVLYGSRQTKTFDVAVGKESTATFSFDATISDCGYYQIDYSSPKPKYTYLAVGFTRALGCVQAASTTTTSTTAQVLGTTVTTSPPTTAAPVRVLGTQVSPAQLPVTGSAMTGLLFSLAVCLSVAGLALVGLSRRAAAVSRSDGTRRGRVPPRNPR